MFIDIRKFFQATNPSKTLVVENTEDQKYYIDFSSVRGGKIIAELKDKITFFSPNEPTCMLFTGHIGCGKSTELLRLKLELEEEGFYVVYFESSEDLEMADVDTGDVLLAIARRVSQSLESINIGEPSKLKELLQGAVRVLNADLQSIKLNIPGLGNLGVSNQNDQFSLAFGIGEITTKAKGDATLRQKLNQYLGPQKTQLLDAINQELLEPAISALKERGKKGLVVIVDNLDRVDSQAKSWGRPQQEYLFIDQSDYLSKLNCHVVYTMPLALMYSDAYGNLTQRFPEDPKVLPMVPVCTYDGKDCSNGMVLLQQMVLARAFPNLSIRERLDRAGLVFDQPETLDRLCRISGGHVRDLLRLLNNWIQRERKLPLTRKTLERLIRARRNEMIMQISEDEWELLRQVRKRKKVGGDRDYQKLIHSRLVFEYRDNNGESWFDVNPIVAEAEELSQP
ncbi:MAG: ATP-binding protein [Cyanobacteria bacterium P01_A01_bin.80]